MKKCIKCHMVYVEDVFCFNCQENDLMEDNEFEELEFSDEHSFRGKRK